MIFVINAYKSLQYHRGVLSKRDDQGIQVNFRDKQIILSLKPFRIDFLVNNALVMSVNSRGLMNFENYRRKP